MSQELSKTSFPLPTFNGKKTSYEMYQMRFTAYAMAKGFSKVLKYDPVDPDLPIDPDDLSSDEEVRARQIKAISNNEKAMAAYTMSFTTDALMVFINLAYTKEYENGLAWKVTKRLRDRYAPDDRISEIEAIEELREVKYNANMTPEDFVNQLLAVQSRYYKLNCLSERELINEFIVKVPKHYRSIVVMELRAKKDSITLEDLRVVLTQHYRIENNKVTDEERHWCGAKSR